MRKFSYILCMLMTIGLLNSCFPEEKVDSTRKFTYDARTLIMGYGEKSSENLTITTAPQLVIEEDYTAATLTIKLNSLYYPGIGVINMESEPLRYSSSQLANGSYKVTISTPLTYFGNYLIEDFSMTTLEQWVSISFTYQNINYVINTSSISRDNITQAYFVLFDGETSFSPTSGSGVFTTTSTKYGLNLNNNSTANMYMYFTKLTEEMDEINLLFQNLSFTMGLDGYTIVSEGNVIPKEIVNNKLEEAPAYEISNFNAYISYTGQGGTMSFDWVDKEGSTQVKNITVSILTSSLEE